MAPLSATAAIAPATMLDPPVSTEAELPPAAAAEPAAKSHAALPASWHLASGALSGAASVLMLQPLDLIKTRIQQDRPPPSSSTAATSATTARSSTPSSHLAAGTSSEQPALKAKVPRAKILTTAREVVRIDGVQGLWRGTVPTLYRNVPGVSLYFLSLSRLRALIGRSSLFRAKASPSTTSTSTPASAGGKVKLTPIGDLLVGSTARTAVGFALTPFTLLKTLSESTLSMAQSAATSSSSPTTSSAGASSAVRPHAIAAPRPPSTFTALRTLYSSGGLRSLWRGAVPTALRDAPGAGLFIVFYERGQRLLGMRGDKGKGAVGGGLAGASASLASTLLTTPFDLLKTRRQLDPAQYKSLWQSVKLVYAQSGILGFWEGGGLRVVRKAGSAGIGWAVYEAFVGMGEKRQHLERDRVRSRSGGG
ncbi:mitochondrial carrier [Rhodotorula sp. JG-1b]|nr:mitochondrial carrier [Rhodotorula sp. JG-1b]